MKKTILMMTVGAFLVGMVAGGLAELRFGWAERLLSYAGPRHNDETDERAAEPIDTQEHESAIRLTDDQMREYGIELDVTGPGTIERMIELPGEIAANGDRLAHIVSRVGGVTLEAKKKLGDAVVRGEVMAVVESRELADAKAAYLAAMASVELARAKYKREESLWEKKISSEQEFLDVRQAFADSQIRLRTAEQKLHALGFTNEYLLRLPELADESFTRYEITAPFDGTVIGKHITTGEVVGTDSEIFVIADLSSVWVDLSVYQSDLPFVSRGRPVVVTAGPEIPQARGAIDYVGPVMGEKTRAVLARVVLSNESGQLRPGLFVTASVVAQETAVDLLVARTAVQDVDGRPCVFVLDEDGFEPRPVTLGQTDGRFVEVTSGLSKGLRYASKGAFDLKARMVTSTMDSHAGHGH